MSSPDEQAMQLIRAGLAYDNSLVNLMVVNTIQYTTPALKQLAIRTSDPYYKAVVTIQFVFHF